MTSPRSSDSRNGGFASPGTCAGTLLLAMVGSFGIALPAAAASASFLGTGIPATLMSSSCNAITPDWIDQVPERTARRVLPRHCVLALDNPPVFSWTNATSPARTDNYLITVQQLQGSSWKAVPGLSGLQVAKPRFMPGSLLTAGSTYRWRVSYNAGAQLSSWRQFQIAPDALGPALPSASAAYAHAATTAHPRLLPPGSSWSEIWNLAQASDLATAAQGILTDGYWLAVSRNGDGTDPTPMPSEPVLRLRSDFASDAAYYIYQSGVEDIATQASLQLREVAFAYQFAGPSATYASSKAAFFDDARARLLALATWTNGSTLHEHADQANRTIYLNLAIAYDLLHEGLSASDRATVVQATRNRIALPLSYVSVFDSIPYRSHEAGTLLFTMRTLALTAGDVADQTQDQVDFSSQWDALSTLTSVWGEYDGATANGVTYGWTDFLDVPETMFVLETTCGANFASRAWFKRAVDNLIAVTPPGQVGPAAFGDSNNANNYASYAHNAVRLHDALAPRASSQWYWRQSTGHINSDSVAFQLLAMGLKRTPASPTPPANDFVSADAGHVAFHTDIANADGTRSSVFFRSSRFGAWSHSHADQNSFVFYSKGVPLLISAGYYDYYGSDHHVAVTRATRYKNAVTFDGGIGQAHKAASTYTEFSANPFGSLLNGGNAGPISVATGDATAAYQSFDAASNQWSPMVTSALRSIAFHKGQRMLLVYDYLKSATPRQWEWNLQALAPFGTQGESVTLPNGATTACISLHNAPASFVQTTGFDEPDRFDGIDPLPTKAYTKQTHGRFAQSTATTKARTLLIIREDCTTPLPPTISFPANEADAAVVGFSDGRTVKFKQKTVSVTY